MMGGAEPTRTETIRQTTMPTEIIQKTITIEGDGNQLTAEELKDIIAKHAGDIGSSEVVTTVSRDYAMAIMLMENESNKVRKPRKKSFCEIEKHTNGDPKPKQEIRLLGIEEYLASGLQYSIFVSIYVHSSSVCYVYYSFLWPPSQRSLLLGGRTTESLTLWILFRLQLHSKCSCFGDDNIN